MCLKINNNWGSQKIAKLKEALAACYSSPNLYIWKNTWFLVTLNVFFLSFSLMNYWNGHCLHIFPWTCVYIRLFRIPNKNPSEPIKSVCCILDSFYCILLNIWLVFQFWSATKYLLDSNTLLDYLGYIMFRTACQKVAHFFWQLLFCGQWTAIKWLIHDF